MSLLSVVVLPILCQCIKEEMSFPPQTSMRKQRVKNPRSSDTATERGIDGSGPGRPLQCELSTTLHLAAEKVRILDGGVKPARRCQADDSERRSRLACRLESRIEARTA